MEFDKDGSNCIGVAFEKNNPEVRLRTLKEYQRLSEDDITFPVLKDRRPKLYAGFLPVNIEAFDFLVT